MHDIQSVVGAGDDDGVDRRHALGDPGPPLESSTDREDDRRGELERLVVEAGVHALGEGLKGADVDREEEGTDDADAYVVGYN